MTTSAIDTDRLQNRIDNRRRIQGYIGLGMASILGYLLLRNVGWQGGKQLHTLKEVLATFLASTVGAVAIVRYYSKKNITFLFIGTAFVGTALLDGYHTIVTSEFFDALFPSSPPSLIPWSWNASRTFLAILMFLSLVYWRKGRNNGVANRFNENQLYFIVAALCILSFYVFAFVPLPRSYYPELLWGRPQEFISGALFLMALAGYLKKGAWKTDSFEHWIVLSLIIGSGIQILFMPSSFGLFDAMFDGAHVLKIVSYLAVLIGLNINIFQMYLVLEESQEVLRREVAVRAKAEEKLTASEARMAAVIESAVDGIITLGRDGKIETFNSASESIFGYTAAEVIGKNVKVLMPPPYHKEHDGYLDNYRNAGEKKIIGIGREVTGRRKDGSTFPMSLAVSETVVDS